MRLFAALTVPEAVADRLISLQSGLPAGRLVPRENLHITLGFFGEVTGPEADDLHFALARIRASAFDLWLDGVDGFGDAKLRQIYAAVRPDPALTHLHSKVAEAARSAGIDVGHRRYVPHVTLARLKAGDRGNAKQFSRWMVAGSDLLVGPHLVDGFHLFRSTLTPSGSSYAQIADYELR